MKTISILILGFLAISCGDKTDNQRKVRIVGTNIDATCLKDSGQFNSVETKNITFESKTQPTLGEACEKNLPEAKEGYAWASIAERVYQTSNVCEDRDSFKSCKSETKIWEESCVYVEYESEAELNLIDEVAACQK